MSKIDRLHTQVKNFLSETKTVHQAVGKIENNFKKDIEFRGKRFDDAHNKMESKSGRGKDKLNLDEVDKLFDQMELEENRSTFSIIFFSANNLLMLATIGFSGAVIMKMS